jgi:hypothetical protein
MQKSIHSKTIGTLIQNSQLYLEEFWESAKFKIPFLDNQEVIITYMFDIENDLSFVFDAEIALKNFLSLTNIDRINLSSKVKENCDEFLNEVSYSEDDDKLRAITNPTEIWKFVTATNIYISKINIEDIYVSVAFECEWEIEHGLQLVFKNGNLLTRISIQDGHLE